MRLIVILALHCFAMCVSANAQPFTVEVIKPSPRFVVIVEQPTASAVATQDGAYLVMFTAKWCGPCQAWKRSQLPRLESAGHRVTVVDVDQDSQWKIERVPTFWVVDRTTRKPLRKFIGAASADVLLPLITVRPSVN